MEQVSATVECPLAVSVREDAEVADANEAIRDDVEEEPADELLGLQPHDFDLIGVGIVLPPEANRRAFQTEDALVGDRNAVGIAAEVVESLHGAGERTF